MQDWLFVSIVFLAGALTGSIFSIIAMCIYDEHGEK